MLWASGFSCWHQESFILGKVKKFVCSWCVIDLCLIFWSWCRNQIEFFPEAVLMSHDGRMERCIPPVFSFCFLPPLYGLYFLVAALCICISPRFMGLNLSVCQLFIVNLLIHMSLFAVCWFYFRSPTSWLYGWQLLSGLGKWNYRSIDMAGNLQSLKGYEKCTAS
jgi:hypothetical protein